MNSRTWGMRNERIPQDREAAPMANNTRNHRVVVGVDGSSNSLAALRRAASEASRRHAVVEAVYVIGPETRDDRPVRVRIRTARSWLRHSIGATLDDRVVQVRERVVAGEPADVLTRLADGADLLVIGAHHDVDDTRPLRGATIPAVLANSPCQVILCADHRTSVSNA